jgi:lipopolysaccharide/colanic/teichoic acid biosynthesis glycosyltransferase
MTSFYRNHGKRLFDLAVGCAALAVAAPVLAVVAAAVRVGLGSPVLFKQQRPGQGGKPFTILKFRTMTDARDPSGRLRSDAERLTRLGKWLRASSLDELPELVNVVRGDMSLVGPRPLLVQYLDRYSQRQAQRHDVRPGITGLAQVRGRNALDWSTRLALDVEYVETHSLALDLRIAFETLLTVVRRSGISADGHATMPEFTGHEATVTRLHAHGKGASEHACTGS